MAYGRRRGLSWDRIVTLGDTVPRSVGGLLIAMLVVTVATMASPQLWGLLALDPSSIFPLQAWRLVTWPFPQGDPLTLLFVGLSFYWVGRDLANVWSERKFLLVFFGYAVGIALLTAVVAQIWAGADRPHVNAWPIVIALLAGWGFSRPGAQINLFGVVPMTAQVFAWIIVGGTVLFALSSPGAAGDYVPHLSALLLMFLTRSGITPRRLWLKTKEAWYSTQLKRRSRHLRPVGREEKKKDWMN